MNCKKGDLAFVVKSEFEGNVGALVEVIEPDVRKTFEAGSFVWRVRSLGRQLFGRHCDTGKVSDDATQGTAFDHQLRTITGWEPQLGVVDEIFSPQPLLGEKGYPFRSILPEDFNPTAVALGIRRRNWTPQQEAK